MLQHFIDWAGKQLSRIKTIGILVLIILFTLSIIKHGCNRIEVEDMIEKLTGLNIRNDILMEDIRQRDSTLVLKEARIQNLLDSLFASESRFKKLEINYSHLQADYEHLADSLLRIPVDTSYHFLTHEAYPYPGHLQYPFNEPQVKGIHLTYLEKGKLSDMNENLLAQLDEAENQIEIKDSVAIEQADRLMLMSDTRTDLDSIVFNKDIIIEDQKKQIKKERRGKRIWQATVVVVVSVVAVLSVSGG